MNRLLQLIFALGVATAVATTLSNKDPNEAQYVQHQQQQQKGLRSNAEFLNEMWATGRLQEVLDTFHHNGMLDTRAMPVIGHNDSTPVARAGWFTNFLNAIELTAYDYNIISVDKARGTVLQEATMSGTVRQTSKSFSSVRMHVLLKFSGNKLSLLSCWMLDVESFDSFENAFRTQAYETVESLFEAYFRQDTAAIERITSQTELRYVGNRYDESRKSNSMMDALKHMRTFEQSVSDIKFINVDQNNVVLELSYYKWINTVNDQPILEPKEGKAVITAHVDDNGSLTLWEVALMPQPSFYKFISPKTPSQH